MTEVTFPDAPALADHDLRVLGTGATRKEDDRLLRGEGQFTDAVDRAHTAEMAVGRCPYPHARIVAVDAAAALELHGVLQVITGADVAARSGPIRILGPGPGGPRLPDNAPAARVG